MSYGLGCMNTTMFAGKLHNKTTGQDYIDMSYGHFYGHMGVSYSHLHIQPQIALHDTRHSHSQYNSSTSITSTLRSINIALRLTSARWHLCTATTQSSTSPSRSPPQHPKVCSYCHCDTAMHQMQTDHVRAMRHI